MQYLAFCCGCDTNLQRTAAGRKKMIRAWRISVCTVCYPSQQSQNLVIESGIRFILVFYVSPYNVISFKKLEKLWKKNLALETLYADNVTSEFKN